MSQALAAIAERLGPGYGEQVAKVREMVRAATAIVSMGRDALPAETVAITLGKMDSQERAAREQLADSQTAIYSKVLELIHADSAADPVAEVERLMVSFINEVFRQFQAFAAIRVVEIVRHMLAD